MERLKGLFPGEERVDTPQAGIFETHLRQPLRASNVMVSHSAHLLPPSQPLYVLVEAGLSLCSKCVGTEGGGRVLMKPLRLGLVS